jgi:hypothetical protein
MRVNIDLLVSDLVTVHFTLVYVEGANYKLRSDLLYLITAYDIICFV